MDKPQQERRRWFHGWSFQNRPQSEKTALIIWLRSGREMPELGIKDRESIEKFKIEILNQKPPTPPDATIVSVEDALKTTGYETPISTTVLSDRDSAQFVKIIENEEPNERLKKAAQEKEKYRNFSPVHSAAVTHLKTDNSVKSGKYSIKGPTTKLPRSGG